MEIKYYEKDNIVSSISVDDDFNNRNPITSMVFNDADESDSTSFSMVHNNIYPNFDSINIFDSTGTVSKDIDIISIGVNSSAIISLPILNDTIKLIAYDYYDTDDNDGYMLKVIDTELTILSDKMLELQDSETYITEKIYNTDENTIIDYILDTNSDFDDSEIQTIYNSRWGLIERDIYTSYNDTYTPKFIFECKSDSTTTYKTITLEDVGNLSENSSSN